MSEDLVVVIAVNHNNEDDVLRIFKSLKKQDYENYVFIVVDDNSDNCSKLKQIDEDKFALAHYPAPFKIGYANKHNYAFIQAINIKAKYIYKMHTDMELISSNLLTELVAKANSDSDVVCVGPRIFNGEGTETWGPGIVKQRCGHQYTVHESYLLRSSYLTDCNGFQDEVFDWFGEEMDFFTRIIKANKKVAQVRVKITHFGGATSSTFRVKKCMYRADSTMVFLYKHNKHFKYHEILRMYLREIRVELMFILGLVKSGSFLTAVKSFSFLCAGFLAGIYKIIARKYNKYPKV